MIPTTQTLLICVVCICGLAETDYGHCTGSRCFVLLKKPEDFQGARKSCNASDGKLFVISLEQAQNTLTAPLGGSYWLEVLSPGRTEETAVGPQNCSSITVSTEGNLTVLWRPCRDRLDGFLCQDTLTVPCSRARAGDGARLRYMTYEGKDVIDSDLFQTGTIALAEKVGDNYLDSKYLCNMGNWLQAPWACEVLRGGCEHDCDSATRACVCPAGRPLRPNNITCTQDPCAGCAQGCQQKGDTYLCTCRDGYRLAQDRKRCVDVDECVEKDPCTGEGETCLNTEGGFECLCKDDFEVVDGVCLDMAVCMKCEHDCVPHNGVAQCTCRKGFKVSARDPNKCEEHCSGRDCLARCIPKADSEVDLHQCYCPNGYIKDIRNNTAFCTDINECEIEKQCDQRCENLFGGYRCLCDVGFKLQDDYMCLPVNGEEEHGSGSAPPSADADLATVPSYIKSGSVLGITVFTLLCLVLLFFMVQNMVKRCGKFKLSSFRRPDIDIFYLQQVTTETYKRLSFDKQIKNDLQRQ